MTTYGTSNFKNFTKACDYYRNELEDATPLELEKYVKQKIEDGDIEIGAPEIREGERLSLNDEGRYIVEVI